MVRWNRCGMAVGTVDTGISSVGGGDRVLEG
jgi:hypothetical protein